MCTCVHVHVLRTGMYCAHVSTLNAAVHVLVCGHLVQVYMCDCVSVKYRLCMCESTCV